MSAPTPEEIRAAVERHIELWNAGDKEAADDRENRKWPQWSTPWFRACDSPTRDSIQLRRGCTPTHVR